MRNLKRVLSLTLASIMLLGMMVVGSSARDYTDVDYSEDNVEAIEVLNAINVMTGDADSSGNLTGTFRPGDEVKRGEMARIMAALMDLDYDYYISVNPFTDMKGHWAEGYAAACYVNGIIAGRTATTYDPEATVTTVEAAAMLMRALGYFQNPGDYADGFEVATVRQGGRIDLFADVDTKTNDPMTRNDVAQLVLNALEARMVDFTGNMGFDVNGVTMGYRSEYTERTSTQAKYNTITESGNRTTITAGSDQYYVQLGEQLYNGDLKKVRTTDGFNALATRWNYKDTEIGVYTDEADYMLEGTVKSNKLYATVGKAVAEDYTWIVRMDGSTTNRNSKDGDTSDPDYKGLFDGPAVAANDSSDLDGTARGTYTYIYLDNINSRAYACIVNTYAAEVTEVKDGKISLNDLDGKTLEFETDDYDEDDVVLYIKYWDGVTESWIVDGILGVAELIEGEASTVRADKYVIIDGITYNYSAMYNDSEIPVTSAGAAVAFYIDLQGNIIFLGDASENLDYALVLGVGMAASKYSGEAEYGAQLMLSDGTVINVDLDKDCTDEVLEGLGYVINPNARALTEVTPEEALEKLQDALKGQVFSYSKNTSGTYTLDQPGKNDSGSSNNWIAPTGTYTGGAHIIENGRSSILLADGSYIYANSNTVFVLNDDNDTDTTYATYTGYTNAPDVDAYAHTKVAAFVSKGVAKVVYVTDGDVKGASSVIFVKGANDVKMNQTADGDKYYTYDAVVNGEITSINVKSGSSAYDEVKGLAKWQVGAFTRMSVDGDDLVTKLVAVDQASEGVTGKSVYNVYTGTQRLTNNVYGFAYNSDSKSYDYHIGPGSKTVLAYVDEDNNLSLLTNLKTDVNDTATVVTEDGELLGVYVVYAAPDEGDEGSKLGTDGTVYLAEGLDKATYGEILSSKVEVNSLGVTTATFSLKAPEWAYSTTGHSASGEITYSIYVNGEKLRSVTSDTIYATADVYKDNLTSNGNGAGMTFTTSGIDLTARGSSVITAAEALGNKVSVEITDIKWNYIPIYFKMAEGYEDIDLGLPTEMWTENTATVKVLNFMAKETGESGAYATIEGIKESSTQFTILGIANTNSEGNKLGVAGWEITPLTNQKIVVTVTPPDGFENTYTVKGEGNLDSTSDAGGVALTQWVGTTPVLATETAKLTITKAEKIESGMNAQVKIALSDDFSDKGVFAYRVSLTVNGYTDTHDVTGSTGVDFLVMNVTKDIEITTAMIKIERIERVYVTSATVNSGNMTLTFNMPVKYASGYKDLNATNSDDSFEMDKGDSEKAVSFGWKLDGANKTLTLTLVGTVWGESDDEVGDFGLPEGFVVPLDDKYNDYDDSTSLNESLACKILIAGTGSAAKTTTVYARIGNDGGSVTKTDWVDVATKKNPSVDFPSNEET